MLHLVTSLVAWVMWSVALRNLLSMQHCVAQQHLETPHNLCDGHTEFADHVSPLQ